MLRVSHVLCKLTKMRIQGASALCGAAQNMIWLVICRAIQGIGGGGIIQVRCPNGGLR